MFNKKFITIGGGTIAVLAVLYLGNMVIRTTPEGDAGGAYQYKILATPTECLEKMVGTFSVGGDKEELQAAKEAVIECVEQALNEKGQEGWELVLMQEGNPPTFIFKKK